MGVSLVEGLPSWEPMPSNSIQEILTVAYIPFHNEGVVAVVSLKPEPLNPIP